MIQVITPKEQVLYTFIEQLEKAKAELLEALKNLRRSYVSLLDGGRDRILELGGDCDPVDVMLAANPNIRDADAAIARATKGEAK